METETVEPETADGETRSSLTNLASRLAGGILDLLRNTARLFAYEARAAAGRVGRGLVLLAFTILVAGGGLLLILVAVALLVGQWVESPWGGFMLVGGATALVAIAASYAVARRLTQEDVSFPETMREIEEDVRWLKGELDAE